MTVPTYGAELKALERRFNRLRAWENRVAAWLQFSIVAVAIMFGLRLGAGVPEWWIVAAVAAVPSLMYVAIMALGWSVVRIQHRALRIKQE